MSLEEWWNTQRHKIYVVHFSCTRRKGRVRTPETRYVQIKVDKDSETIRQIAAMRAKRQSIDFNDGANLYYHVRLAHPVNDLNCYWGGSGADPLAA